MSGSATLTAASAERRASVMPTPEGHGQILLSVPGIRCGACVASVERRLAELPEVVSARANLTLRRVTVTLANAGADPLPVIEKLQALGYPASPIDTSDLGPQAESAQSRQLVRAMAVAGFGAANIMLLSVAVWSGADGATRETFHLISGLIALPIVAYSGRPFFDSALRALRAGRTNMDVPISIGILLAVALSVVETVQGGAHVFFDAAVTLIFFLLAGRYLDQLMREKARSAITGLARLAPKGASVERPDGTSEWLRLDAVAPGMILHIGPGETVPLDVRVVEGATDIDRSLVTGESMPIAAGLNATLEAGTRNLTGTLRAEVLRAADESFLAQMQRMLGEAEAGRGRYVRIADRAARLYAPVVHSLALLTFIGWVLATGDWRASAFVAISVLIITCPCALGLAVPVAHVVAAGRLMREGVLMKDGSALERLAQIDHVVFDKTGTLTTGQPRVSAAPTDPARRAAARALAAGSVHPAALAITAHLPECGPPASDLREVPGFGIEAVVSGRRARLGRSSWVAEIASGGTAPAGPAFAFERDTAEAFHLAETLRDGARETIAELEARGLTTAMLSGDVAERAKAMASRLGIAEVHDGATPADKIGYLNALQIDGRRAMMVGDGLNDTAALAAAHVSMAPSSASDAGRSAADLVFLRDGLQAVAVAHDLARRTARLVSQNIGLAVAYNCLAIPLAMAGQVTPLIAALAMSGSSLLVIGNALRLNRAGKMASTPSLPAAEGLEVPA
ncbi:cadmium-translocating P-type ATPase [Paracoccus suum]|uniref:Cadmium-translocating P-type ATPase n=1 Tax=Paracoccus suum TaxID=2259340 RepID=A0A344PME1_9RHOB|nr:heavy metal translocating P-type ATPase [Paracoccus suum]AXC50546.1 cadmium-translocating P-type ATPase [Paracoccus suum]